MSNKFIPWSDHGLLQDLPHPHSDSRRGWPWNVQFNPLNFLSIKEDLNPILLVIPTFNQGPFIEEAIRSILLQNYPKLILVVIDGGSTDQTLEVLERYRPWLSYIYSGPDSGQASALNSGFDIARDLESSGTAFCGWLNSDDLYVPNTFFRLCNHSKLDSEIVYGDSLELHQLSNTLSYHLNPIVSSRYIKYGGLLASHAVFWKASIHQEFDERYHCALDYEYWLRLVPGRRLGHVKYPLGIIRVHNDAKSHSPLWQKNWDADMILNGEKHRDLYTKNILLDVEYKIVNRLNRFLSRRRIKVNMESVCDDMQRWR